MRKIFAKDLGKSNKSTGFASPSVKQAADALAKVIINTQKRL